MTTGELTEVTLGDLLKDEEIAFLRRADLRCADSVHGLLAAAPSAAQHGVRRDMLLELLRPILSREYAASLDERPAASGPAVSGALPGRLYHWTNARRAAPAAAPRLADIDLLATLDAGAWLVRDQAGRPNCVAHAVAGCIELMLATRNRTFRMLSFRFVDDRLRARRSEAPPGDGCEVAPAEREAKLCEARDVLALEGIPPEAAWREGSAAEGSPVPAAVRQQAAQLKARPALYKDRPTEADREEPGLAAAIHAELAAGRPVAVALPGFRDPTLLTGATSWRHREVWLRGILPDAGDDVPVPGSGHVVCLVGFQVSAAEPHGGYFVFKNSWDEEFGALAPGPGAPTEPPFVPRPGYGAMPATLVEQHCWEALSLSL